MDAPWRDLGYEPKVGLAEMVAHVLGAQDARNVTAAELFQTMDTDGAGLLNRGNIERSKPLRLPLPLSLPSRQHSTIIMPPHLRIVCYP